MNIIALRPHPLTIFYFMHSYWLVFVAPPVRILLQYAFIKEAQIFLLSETVAVAAAFVFAVFRWFSTKIVVYKDVWEVKKGLFVKSCSIITLSNASGIYIKRGFVDVIFKSANVFINTQTDNTKQNNLKIKFKLSDLEKIFVCSSAKNVYPIRTRRNFCRFFIVPVWVAVVVLMGLLTVFRDFEIIPTLTILAINAYFAVICYYNYKKGSLSTDKNISIIGSKGLSLYSFYCKKENVGIIKIYQTPADRNLKTCKIKFYEYGEGSKGIKVRNVDLDDTVIKINKAFGLNIDV